MTNAQAIDVVAAGDLHVRLGFAERLELDPETARRPFIDWRMEVDDAQILRYLFRNLKPRRHLEFGTWEGAGTCLCLRECDATVWTINLPGGELVEERPAYASALASAPQGAAAVERLDGCDVYQTDAGLFVGRLYRQAGFGHRVCQIYCDSRDWDTSSYPEGFFDSALIDGGHSQDVVASDTRKALALVRPGGLVMWHDFCPDPSLFEESAAVSGVVTGVAREWERISHALRDAFWIQPSLLLVGVR
jgi:predicted O-methyltransferase YrrM